MGTPGDYQYQGAFPTVSKEQWVKHSIRKLSRGYMLIVSNTRNVANFYKGYGDFETCSYHTARRLIREGFLEACGEHMLGTMYQLKPEFKEEQPATRTTKDRKEPPQQTSLLDRSRSFDLDEGEEEPEENLEDEEADASLEDGFLAELNDDAEDPDAIIL